jgi:hypothetical protein
MVKDGYYIGASNLNLWLKDNLFLKEIIYFV